MLPSLGACIGPGMLGPPVIAASTGPQGGQATKYRTVEVLGSSAWIVREQPEPKPDALVVDGSMMYLTADSLLEIGPVGYAGANGIGVGLRARFPIALTPRLWIAPGGSVGMLWADFTLPLTIALGGGHLLNVVAGHRFHSRGSIVPASVGWAWLSPSGHGLQAVGSWTLVSVGDRAACWQPYCEAGRSVAAVAAGYLRRY